MSKELNDADAIMIGRAFEYASKGAMRNFPAHVAEYINDLAPDRRYKLQWLAASSDYVSAVVRYRGRKLYVYGKWDSESKTRTYYAEFSANN